MKPRPWSILVLVVACALFGAGLRYAQAQGPLTPSGVSREQAAISRLLLEQVVGAPARVNLGDQATLRLEGSLQFIERDLASHYLRAYSQEEPDDLVGMFFHGGRDAPWIATARLVRDGFIDIEAIRNWKHEDILASIRDEVARENQERAQRGLPPRIVSGWLIPPRYDPETRSLVWSVQTYVQGVSAQNESDTLAHVAVFGREAHVVINIISSAATIRDYPRDISMLVNNIRFVAGRTYADFVAGTDQAAPGGLNAVFGVTALRPIGFIEKHLDADRLMIFIIGGGMILVAGIMALLLLAANRRLNRRRT